MISSSPLPCPVPVSVESVHSDIYPTPPPSPDLITNATNLPESPESAIEPEQPGAGHHSTPLRIPVLLNTPHLLPHTSSFRLASPTDILSVLGGSRVLQTDEYQTIWDRMPYSAATAVIGNRDVTEEDQIETLVGGERPQNKTNGLQWALRDSKSTDRLSSIFVQPPTPERVNSPASEEGSSTPRVSPFSSPRSAQKALAQATALPLPVHVLPEVRSPPRRLVEAADSLQITRRGRRPRLFGFTELPESNSSSAQSSPERQPKPSPSDLAIPTSSSSSATPTPISVRPSLSTSGSVLPRRHAVRTKSESALGITTLPRKRDNGLKLNLSGVIPSQPAIETPSVVPSPFGASLIRKKSGEILKSALKYGGPLLANGTPLATPQPEKERERTRFESKSCPTTPSCPKYVHFDTQLERVKLFLHDQKPHAVSRDGSPTHDHTSEGEEFPFPSTDEEKDLSRVLQIRLPNFPTSHPPDAELFLESLFLDDDRKSLRGIVTCKNIAFQKWVAIRFTLDWWQTTSEVTATHKDSIKGGAFDRFTFVVKLHDVLTKIEEKTLFLAIRYTTNGREIWDSNNGQNYQVLFEKVVPQPSKTQPARSTQSIQPGMGKSIGGRTSQWSVTGGGNDKDRLADLRSKLDRLVADDLDQNGGALSPGAANRYSQLSPSRRTLGGSPQGSPMRGITSLDHTASDLPAAGPLAARYDFGTALKTSTSRRRNSNSPNGDNTPLPDVQTGLLQYPKGNRSHAASEFYSPRSNDAILAQNDYFFASPPVNSMSTIPNLHVQGPSPPAVEESTVTPENQQGLARRPTTLSRSFTSPATYSSPLTPLDAASVSPPQLDGSGTGSVTESPSDSPKSPQDVSLLKWSPSGGDDKEKTSLASYSSFIEQFCWGGAAPSTNIQPRKSHSSSSLDEYFSSTNNSSPGSITPKPTLHHHHSSSFSGPIGYPDSRSSSISSTPSSSYYTTSQTNYSTTSTPTRKDFEDIDSLTETVRSLSSSLSSTPLKGSPVARISGLPDHRSPPVVF